MKWPLSPPLSLRQQRFVPISFIPAAEGNLPGSPIGHGAPIRLCPAGADCPRAQTFSSLEGWGLRGYVIKGPHASVMTVEFKTHLSRGLCRGSHRFDVCLQGTPLPSGVCRLDRYPAAPVPVKQAVSVLPSRNHFSTQGLAKRSRKGREGGPFEAQQRPVWG